MISRTEFNAIPKPRIIQEIGGLPYWTRWFRDEPIINPPVHMAGQRVYRDWVLEDVCFNLKKQNAILAEDHAYHSIRVAGNHHEIISKS